MNEKKTTTTVHGYKAEHVRILREGLAYVGRGSTDKNTKARALAALKAFAVIVAGYCSHSERSADGRCLWCGAPE